MVNSIIRTRKSENTANIYMKKMDISQNKLKNINKYINILSTLFFVFFLLSNQYHFLKLNIYLNVQINLLSSER